MEQAKLSLPRLFTTSVIECKKDDLDEKYERGYHMLQTLTSGLSEKEAHDALNNAVCKDKAHEEIVSLGLISIILSEPHNAAKSYRDLTLVSRDGLGLVLVHLSQLILERWLRLQDPARVQLLWLVREMIRNAVAGVDTLCWNLMRHAAGGDVSHRNIALIEALLDIYHENRGWLEKYPWLLASVAYSYLRFIEDHAAPSLAPLRLKEAQFTATLLRDRFTECLVIGRDLVRLLQSVARLPEFEAIWRDLLTNPKALSPVCTGVLQLLQTRTSRRFLQSRLTPDMERKMVFLTSSVRFGHHKRYQDWFQRQYLATPESQSLRCDLIRFIVGVIHPTNELLCSDIIPRWAVIGWLLTTCTSNVAAANAKLALFYDWLFFEPDKDNIMNIEPAILVMHHSMRSHPAVTATLLDFLCRIIPSFYPPLLDKVRQGIFSSLRQILEKRVLPSLFPLFDNSKLDRELRVKIRETFYEFCFPPTVEGLKPEVKEELGHRMDGQNHLLNNHQDTAEPVFSDEEGDLPAGRHPDDEDDDDIPLAKVRLKERPSPTPSDLRREESDISLALEGDLRVAVETLYSETDNEAKCEAMERLVQLVTQDDELRGDQETLSTLGSCLCNILHQQLEERVFPSVITEETLEDSIGRPLFVLCRNLCELREEDPRRLPLLSVLAEMAARQPRIGYLLLYYLQASVVMGAEDMVPKSGNGKSHVYKEFCVAADKELEACLLSDLKLCQEEDTNLFCWLVPGAYTQFSGVAVGHCSLLHLVVSTVDAKQLQELICRVVQGRLVMFQRDSFLALLSVSLTWETFEQYCLWQLVTAHGIPVDYVLPILPRLEFSDHAEALTSILLMLKQERPTAETVRQVLSRDVRPGDSFVVSVLVGWCREYEERLAELVAALLGSRCPATSPNKRKRGSVVAGGGGGRGAAPLAGTILGHLDMLRASMPRQLYKLEAMQKALQQAQAACTDAQRNAFSNLFALVEVEETKKGGRGGRKPANQSSASAKPSSKSRNVRELITDSSEESSEEEEIVKPKQTKKRKKIIPVCSDTD